MSNDGSDPNAAVGVPSGILGVILAGGRSTRMGGLDKGGLTLAGRPMVAHVIMRFEGQVERLLLNAPRDRHAAIDLPHVPDPIAGQPGPLTGLLAAMRWAQAHAPGLRRVASVPVDAPFLPLDLVRRLRMEFDAADAEIAFAVSPSGPQPVFVLADMRLADRLERDLVSGDASRVGDWLRRQRHVLVGFDDDAAFANVNSPQDLAAAEARIAGER